MIWTIGVALCLVLLSLVWGAARERPEHRPIAAILTLGLVTDVARQALARFVFDRLHASGGAPFTGWARVAGHVGEALFLAYPAGLAALSTAVLHRRRPEPVAVVYAVAVVALVLGYPTVRGAILADVYLVAELSTIAVWAIGAVAWWRRRELPNLAVGVVLLLGAVEGVTLLPLGRGPFSAWPIAEGSYVTLYAVLIVLYGGIGWNRGSSSSECRSRSA